uniref:Uncharacterized protein n=1 Tax=viral metagenome TaxID=1070528 RepID=A0A6C0EUI9_9ZZZZ
MSLAFYASPIDYKNNDLEDKIKSEKNKLDKNTLMNLQGIQKSTLQESPTTITDIHKNLKEDNEEDLTNFYKAEENIKIIPQYKTNEYMIMNDTNGYNVTKPTNNQALLEKMNTILEMFEDQKEIKTNQKNEEIVLYCFLGVFIIYIMDSFVSIGKYSR